MEPNGNGGGEPRGRRKLVSDIEKTRLSFNNDIPAVKIPEAVEKTVSGIKKEPVRKKIERSVSIREKEQTTTECRDFTFLNRGVFEQLEEGWVNMDESTDSEIREMLDHQRGMLSDFHDYMALVLTIRWDEKKKKDSEITDDLLCYSRIVAAPRTGKTTVAAEIARRTNLPFIFVVPTTDLRRQSATEFKKLLPNKIVTEYIEGINLNLEYDVIVVSYQLLQSRNRAGDEEIFDILKHYPLAFFDEGHGSTTEDRTGIIREKFNKDTLRIALTGTPDYSEKRKLEDFYPNEIHTLTIAEAVEMGVYSPFMYEVYEIDIDASSVKLNKDLEYDQEQIDKIMSQAAVFAFVKEILKMYKGVPGLVTCTSKSQTNMFLEYLKLTGETDRKIKVLTEDTPNREEILKKYENGEIDTLVVVKLLVQGWDSPRCKLLVDIAPTASPVLAGQKFCRPLTKKDVDDETQAYIYNLVPSNLLFNPISPGDVFSIEDMPLPSGVIIRGGKNKEKSDKDQKKEVPETFQLEGVKVRSVSSLLEHSTSKLLTPEKLQDKNVFIEIIKSACIDSYTNKFDESELMRVIAYKKVFDRTIFRCKYFVGYGRQITRVLKLHDDASFAKKMQETFPEEIAGFLLIKDDKNKKMRNEILVSDDVRHLERELRKIDEDDEMLLQYEKNGTEDNGEVFDKRERNRVRRIKIVEALEILSGDKRYPYQEYDVVHAESFIDEMMEHIDLEFLRKLLDKVMIKFLTEREIIFITERFFENKTLKEIGESVGLSSEYVRSSIFKAIDRLENFFYGVGLEMMTLERFSSKYKKPGDILMEEKIDFVRQNEDVFFREKSFFDQIKKSNDGDFIGRFFELVLEEGIGKDYVINLLDMIANDTLSDRERQYLDERIKNGNSLEKIAEILNVNLTLAKKIDRSIITKIKLFFEHIADEMKKTGNYRDKRLITLKEQITFVQEHENWFFREKSFFGQLIKNAGEDYLRKLFDASIENVDNAYWQKLLGKIIKEKFGNVYDKYFEERIKNNKTQQESADMLGYSLKRVLITEKNMVLKIEDFFDTISYYMSSVVAYKHKNDIPIKEKIKFLRENESKFFEKSE